MLRRLTCLLVFVVGCSAAGRRGDAYFERGDFLNAERAYREALAEDPKDHHWQERRDEARRRAIAAAVDRSRTLRLAGHPEIALPSLGAALQLKEQWPSIAATAEQRARFDVEAQEASLFVQRDTRRLVALGQPLAAEATLAALRAPIPHAALLQARTEAAAQVQTAGSASCRRLVAGSAPENPYWAFVVSRYCAHFREQVPVPALPHARRAVTFSGALAGATAEERADLEARLSAWFQRTVWYAPDAEQVTTAAVSGTYQVSFAVQPIQVHAPWTERIPYTVVESYQEPYQQSYYATEYYTELVPHTTYQTEMYSCGFGKEARTCTRTRPVSQLRSESRTRQVLRHRTAYRPATRLVTHYRNEPRVFTYAADQHTGTYGWTGTVTIASDETSPPVMVRFNDAETLHGLSHDVTFSNAGVSPRRPELPTRALWLARRAHDLGRRLAADLEEAWTATRCARDRYTLEEAARCVATGRATPAVLQALQPAFGADARLVPPLMRVRAAAPGAAGGG